MIAEAMRTGVWLHDDKDTIHDKIERVFGQFERGEFLSAEESQTDMQKRKAAWLADQKREWRSMRFPPSFLHR